MIEKKTLSDAWYRYLKTLINVRSRNQILEIFLENYVSSEGAVSQNVLYYQPLPNTDYQVRLYTYNYFE